METKFKRNEDGSYDVLSSKGDHYYEVQMLGNVAISCKCDHRQKGKQRCKHMTAAEQAETEFQAQQRGFSTSEELASRDRWILASLNGDRSFNLLKR